jgi:hypothetical protein
MTLETTQAETRSPISVFADTFPNWAMVCIGMEIPEATYRKNGVLKDVERWLCWMLYGGNRPYANKRSIHAAATVQDILCRTLDETIGELDFDDPTHFALIERVTRPLPAVRIKRRQAADES